MSEATPHATERPIHPQRSARGIRPPPLVSKAGTLSVGAENGHK